MEPNPNSFPILSYVLSRKQSINIGGDNAARRSDHDVELVVDRLPELKSHALMASMAAAVSNVAQTRSVLEAIGDRPDHEAVDLARRRLADIDAELARRLEEIVLTTRPDGADRLAWRAELTTRESSCRAEAEKERAELRTIVQLDGMHDAYENLLKDAEKKLVRMYEGSTAGVEAGDEEGREEMSEEVVGILQQGFASCVERIDLSGRQLRLLPEPFGKLRGLVYLNLSSNQLEVIPDAIAGLECLEDFLLSSNFLTSLPDSIGLLMNLKILDVSGNKLELLPDSICKCRSLIELNVSYNELTYLPTNIGYEVLNLEKLWIHLNKIRSLPTSVCEMRSLHILDAHFNELRGLPFSIGKLINLEVLNISSNFSDLQELPASVGDLINLRELDLSNNQICMLPDTFGRLDKLMKLNLDQNPLVIPPMEVVNEGVEAVKEYMAKRWLDILVEQEMKSIAEEPAESNTGWLTRSTSWLNNLVTGVSESVSSFMDNGRKSIKDPCLDQEL